MDISNVFERTTTYYFDCSRIRMTPLVTPPSKRCEFNQTLPRFFLMTFFLFFAVTTSCSLFWNECDRENVVFSCNLCRYTIFNNTGMRRQT